MITHMPEKNGAVVLAEEAAAGSGGRHWPSRRKLLRALATVAISSPALAAAEKVRVAVDKGQPVKKIDTHHHFFPKVYVDAVGMEMLASVMPNGRAPTWSPQEALAMLDANGIQEGILSISSGPPLPNAATLLRQCNESAAELRSRYKGRFG
jgi:hypothetical protein